MIIDWDRTIRLILLVIIPSLIILSLLQYKYNIIKYPYLLFKYLKGRSVDKGILKTIIYSIAIIISVLIISSTYRSVNRYRHVRGNLYLDTQTNEVIHIVPK